MILRRFECPDCGKMLAESDGQVVRTKCKHCRRVVEARPLELQLTVECKRCSRRHYYERPQLRPQYCVQCGADTLVSVPALEKKPIEALVPVIRGQEA